MTGTASGAATRPVTVIGSGPVALAHALFSAPHRPVRLAAWPPTEGAGTGPTPVAPSSAARPPIGVEAVPAPVLTLLLELGIHPRELDVEELHRRRFVAWDALEPGQPDEPEERPARAAAHLERGALLAALWRRVRSCPDIYVLPDVLPPVLPHLFSPEAVFAPASAEGTVVDARGRSAAAGPTGGRRFRPPRAWVASTGTVARGDLDGSLRLAAGPGGYGYRLGSASHLTVGWVAPGPPPRTAGQLRATLVEAGAGWLLDGVAFDAGSAVRQRIASLSAAVEPGRGDDRRGDAILRLGDSALARDALASQGLANGLSDARLAARPDWTATDARGRTAEGASRHVHSLAGVLEACRHRDRPAWRAYTAWVRGLDAAWTR